MMESWVIASKWCGWSLKSLFLESRGSVEGPIEVLCSFVDLFAAIMFMRAYVFKPCLPVSRDASLILVSSTFINAYIYLPLEESTQQAYESGLADGEALAKQREVHYSIIQFMGCICICKSTYTWAGQRGPPLKCIRICVHIAIYA